MKKCCLIGFVSWILITVLWVSVGSTADSFRFTESTSYYTYYWGFFFWDWREFTQFTIKAKISLAGVDINWFNEDTQIQVQLNNFYYTAYFGEDPRYVTGKKSAKLRYFKSENSKRPLFTVNLKWNEEQLTVKITAPKCYDTRSLLGLTSDYFGDESGSIKGTTSATILLKDTQGVLLDAEFHMRFKGTVSTKTFRVGNAYKPEEEYDFHLSKIRIRGSGTRVYSISPVSQ
jgi:hypothetical protein